MCPVERTRSLNLEHSRAFQNNPKENRDHHDSSDHHVEQRCRDARARPRRLPDPSRRNDQLPSRRHLPTGYRHIDTAAAYGNEREVGEGIRRSGLDRGEVFIETKVWISDYGYDETLHAFEKSAAKLGVEQIDLLILHQPLPTTFDRTIAAYRALETLLADGKVRAIGVSNFMPEYLESLAGAGRRRPCREPDRGSPVLHAGATAATERPARNPDPGLVADRRYHRLPRRDAEAHLRRPRHSRDRGRSRQDGRASHAALAHAAGPVGDPEVGAARSGSRRTSTSSTSSSATPSSGRSTRSTQACAAAPSRTDITLENYGRPIPEA